MTQFNELGLSPLLLKALAAEGYEQPTPIQAEAIPHLLAGRDLLGIAQTGTGKTAAFALPILHRLAADRRPPARKTCRALVLSPTRELATQIADSFRTYGRHLGFRVAVVFGGVGHRPQADALARGVDILVATPGRLLDHIDGGGLILGATEVFVLDEADRMLDMGFIPSIRRIVPLLPAKRQTLFFSATMPKEARPLVATLLTDPVTVTVKPGTTTAERIGQSVHFVDSGAKRRLLASILKGGDMGRTLVFSRTKHGADRIVRQLEQDGISAAAIHGNKSQGHREKALAGFRSGATPILVATDIAARGIDVDDVTHVINFDLPNVPETYVHRIGRTARAGAAGTAVSFCSPEEREFLRDIEKLIRQPIPVAGKAATSEAAEQAEPAPHHGAVRPARGARPPSRGKPREKAAAEAGTGAARPAGQARQGWSRGQGRAQPTSAGPAGASRSVGAGQPWRAGGDRPAFMNTRRPG